MKKTLAFLVIFFLCVSLFIARSAPATAMILDDVGQTEQATFLELNLEQPLYELTTGQFLDLFERPQLFSAKTCADFSGLALGQQFSPAQFFFVTNNVRFSVYTDGGAVISDFPNYPSTKFLETRGAIGSLIIDTPLTSGIELYVLQGGPDPISIEYFSNGGATRLGTRSTTLYNTLDLISIGGQNLTTVILSNPEILVSKVCYVN